MVSTEGNNSVNWWVRDLRRVPVVNNEVGAVEVDVHLEVGAEVGA